MAINVVLIERSTLARDALRGLVQKIDDRVNVMDASTLDDYLKASPKAAKVDLVLFSPPGCPAPGGPTVQEIARAFSGSALAVYCENEDPDHIIGCKFQGARGFIPKTASAPVILNALRLIASGAEYFPSTVIDSPNATSSSSRSGARDTDMLSARQRNVLHAIATGSSNALIAKELGVSVATVKAEVQKIIDTLGASNRTDAAIKALRLGLITIED